MTIKIEHLQAVLLLLGSLVACASVSFHVGFFLSTGLQFISLAGVQDWLTVGISLVPLLLLGFAVETLFPRSASSGLRDSDLEAKAGDFTTVDLVVGLISAAIALMLGYGLIFVIVAWSDDFGGAAAAAMAAWIVSRVLDRERSLIHDGSIDLAASTRLLVAFCLANAAWGYITTKEHSASCDVLLEKTAYRDIRYLRYFSEGHLLRMNNDTVYIPKGEVKEVRCK